jgi:hypothetical protein
MVRKWPGVEKIINQSIKNVARKLQSGKDFLLKENGRNIQTYDDSVVKEIDLTEYKSRTQPNE